MRDHDYILLSRGLKSIPNPKDKNAKLELLKDFDELARKMRYRYCFHKNSDKLHPFYQKTGYEPEFSCHSLENYISLTKFQLSYLPVRKFRDNISEKERQSIKNLKRNKQLVIKKAEKHGNVVVLNKDNYLSEGYLQLNMPHYEQIENHNLENLQTELNKYINNMWSDGVLDKATVKFIWDGLHKNIRPSRTYFLPKVHKLNKSDVDRIIHRLQHRKCNTTWPPNHFTFRFVSRKYRSLCRPFLNTYRYTAKHIYKRLGSIYEYN